MDRFEYKCILILRGGVGTTKMLNDYGREGWELVAAWWAWHWLKRKLPESA